MGASGRNIGFYRTWAWATTIAAIILAVGLIVAFVGELASDDWGWRWGSAGDWVGGIGGILAFAAALGIALVEHQRFTNERERREASEQELRDRELRLRAAAIIVRRAGGSSSSQGTKFGLAIENMSDSFISDVELTAYYSEDRFPNVESDDRHDSDTRPILRPHPAGGYQWKQEFRGPPGVVGREPPVFRVRWIDADGGRWQTDPEGKVFRIPIDADDDLWHDPALIGEPDRHTPL